MKIIQASETHLDLIIPLFDDYRFFYGENSNVCKAKNFIQDRLQKADSIIFLATETSKSTAIGFAQLYPSFTSIGTGKTFILNDLYVSPQHRKNGIANKLLKHIKEFAQKNGAVKITLQTASSNISAQKLYESLGYKQEKNFISFYLDL